MKKRILLIIMTLILIILGIIGIFYFNSYRNNSLAKSEYENTTNSIPEDIVNTIKDETDATVNQISENIASENENNTVQENTNVEVNAPIEEKQTETKQVAQTTSQPKQTSTSTKTKNNSSNNNTKKTSTSVTTTTPTTKEQPTQQVTTPPPTTESNKKVDRCTNNSNHSLGVGNSGKWFNSKNDAIAYYNSQVKYWGDWWENSEFSEENNKKYYANCPSGYEVWDCMYCGKWTINFYYR